MAQRLLHNTIVATTAVKHLTDWRGLKRVRTCWELEGVKSSQVFTFASSDGRESSESLFALVSDLLSKAVETTSVSMGRIPCNCCFVLVCQILSNTIIIFTLSIVVKYC